MHSFPSTGDARSMWQGLWAKGMPVIGRVDSIPLMIVIYLGALGSVFWLNLVYGLAVAVYLPRLLVR